LKVEISDRKLKKIIHDKKKLTKEYGPDNAKLIIQRFNELSSIADLGLMIQYRIGRCHSLTGNLKGKYALDLQHPMRMIIEPLFEGNQDLLNVVAVRIIEIGDYHE